MTIAEIQDYGPHKLALTDREVVIYRLHGVLDIKEMTAMMEQQAVWQGDRGWILLLIDLRASDGISATALRRAQAQKDNKTPRAVALMGASFAIRAVADVLFRALRSISGGAVNFRFFQTEEESLAWLESERDAVIGRADAQKR